MADWIVPLKRMPCATVDKKATPCKASDHHWYAGMPSLGTAGAELTSWDIFSSNVSLETRSWTLVLMGSVVLQKGWDLVCGSEVSQENGG